MARAQTPKGDLHYETLDHTVAWQKPGLPVLFHHGIGSSSALWRGWAPALVDRYPLTAFDMRGCGRSSVPPADYTWSLDAMVEDLFAVADAAGLERFHLAGESIGGTIALAATLARPKRVATLTVSNGAHLGATIGRVHAWQKQLDEGGEKGWSRAFMPDRFHPDGVDPARWAWFEEQQAAWPRETILKSLAVLIGADLTPRLGEIGCPVLLLHPDGSPFIPVPVMAELHRLLPTSRLQIFPHARHGLPFSHARECSTAFRSFLDSVSAG